MLEQLQQALQLTHQLSEAIHDEDLEKAQAIQTQRIALLQSAEQLALPEDSKKHQEIQRIALEIKALEKSITGRLSKLQNDVLNQHQTQQKRQKMIKAYKDIGR